MRLVLKKKQKRQIPQIHQAASLAELGYGEEGILRCISLPDDVAQRLMELGFVPGGRVQASHQAPGGDARVFRVDGSEIALRRETAALVMLRVAVPDEIVPEGS